MEILPSSTNPALLPDPLVSWPFAAFPPGIPEFALSADFSRHLLTDVGIQFNQPIQFNSITGSGRKRFFCEGSVALDASGGGGFGRLDGRNWPLEDALVAETFGRIVTSGFFRRREGRKSWRHGRRRCG